MKKTDRHDRNTICHKQISKLDFEKDIINELMEICNVKQKEIDQIKKELKSTNPHKINKRKGKQKEIIMKLIDSLPNHLKDKKDYLLNLESSIDIPVVCIKCKNHGYHVKDCGKKEKVKKEKTKRKQERIDIKPVIIEDL